MHHAHYTQMLNNRDGMSREIKENGGVWCEEKEKKKDENLKNNDAKVSQTANKKEISAIQQCIPLIKHNNWKQQQCVSVVSIQALPTHMNCSPRSAWMVDTGMEVSPWPAHERELYVPLAVHVAPAPVKMAKEYNKYSITKARGGIEKTEWKTV